MSCVHIFKGNTGNSNILVMSDYYTDGAFNVLKVDCSASLSDNIYIILTIIFFVIAL